MDDKLMSTIDKITRLTQQNAEFDMELRKRLNVASANSVLLDDERINQIYEYCIEKIIRQQAIEFYTDFPLQSTKKKESLIGDFVRMEFFRRKDNFGDFCLALYQQIECMTNWLCEERELSDITERMWGHPAYVKTEKGKEPSISNRSSKCTIASLLFPGNDQSGNTNAYVKSSKSLKDLYAMDKIYTIVYFLGYKAMMTNSDYKSFKKIKSLLYDIYQCRNMNHRGNSQSPWENRIIPLKSLYYFKFLGVLAQYVEYIKEGYIYIPKILEFCETNSPQKIERATI